MKLLLVLIFISLPLLSYCKPQGSLPQKNKDSSYINSAPSASVQPVEISALPNTPSDPFHSFEFMLSIIVLFFGIIVIALEVYLASIKVIQSEHIFKCVILTLVIIGSILLITAGYSNNQITGITGILGSIAGYLLAKTNFSNEPEKSIKTGNNENK